MPAHRTPGRARLLVFGATLGVVLTMAGFATTAPIAIAGSATITHEKVDGFLQGFPGDCPDVAPADPLVCHEVVLTAFRTGTNDSPGGVAPPKSTWVLLILRHTLTFPGGGADPVESDAATGFVVGADVTFDQQHLSSAVVRAHGVSLDDGSTMNLDATWTATSDRFVAGNNGPALGEFGEVHHVRTDCLNEVNQGHQKVRMARVDAVINGTPSSYDGEFAVLSFNQFISIDVHPASCP